MAENSDAAQARVFADMLTAEIAAASSRIEDSEQLARKALRVGDSRSHVRHSDEAQTQKQSLYELHRQLDALRNRFPAVHRP
jgi:polyhydroxyalkanoate synthesis regulator phasin